MSLDFKTSDYVSVLAVSCRVDAIKRRSNGFEYGRRFDIVLVFPASCDGGSVRCRVQKRAFDVYGDFLI